MIGLALLFGGVVHGNPDQYPDFYAVKINLDVYYKIFTRIRGCTIYKSEEKQKVLFQDGKWKIGKLPDFDNLRLPCRNITDLVEETYRHFTGSLTADNNTSNLNWVDVERSHGNKEVRVNIEVKSLRKCKEVRGFKLVGATLANDYDRDICMRYADWEGLHPDENIFVSFRDPHCYYDFDHHVSLETDHQSSLYIHSRCHGEHSVDFDEENTADNDNNQDHEHSDSSFLEQVTTNHPNVQVQDTNENTSIQTEEEQIENDGNRTNQTKEEGKEGLKGNMNMMTYISIGLGALILIMASLFILFVIRARGRPEVENVRPEVERLEHNLIYGLHEHEGATKTVVRDINDYYGADSFENIKN